MNNCPTVWIAATPVNPPSWSGLRYVRLDCVAGHLIVSAVWWGVPKETQSVHIYGKAAYFGMAVSKDN
jgi:hypothetical protein